MLARKIGFRCVRLIMLLGLAFAGSSAMSDDFDVKIEGRTTLTYAAGETAVSVKLKVIADEWLPHPLLTSLAVFDKDGFPIAIDVNAPEVTVTDDLQYAMRTGRLRQLVVNISVAIDDRTVDTVVVTVPRTATPDPTVPEEDSMSKVAHHTITLSEAPAFNVDRPSVVSIQRLGPSTQTVTSAFEEAEISGAFDVRIVLTERPYGGLTLDKIQVEGGTASDLVVGVPFAWQGGRNADGTRNPAETLRPHPSEGMYAHSGAFAGIPAGADGVTVPLPSGEDDMYHQYRVRITPYYGARVVKISIKTFHDNALPLVNVYTPLNVEHKPNGREQLRLAVATYSDTLGAASTASVSDEEPPVVSVATSTLGDDSFAKDSEVSEAASVKTVAVADTSVSVPMEGKIYISEIMVAGGGVLPQWIEIANGSRTELVNLSGWTLTVENAPVDADVSVGSKATFTVPEGLKIGASGQNDTPSTALIVTEQGRTNIRAGSRGSGQIVNLWTEQQLVLFRLGVAERRYSLLSDVAFRITLAPPEPDVTPSATDVVGNLDAEGGAAWALPTSEDGRSSIIRRHVQGSMGSMVPKDGTQLAAWVLASDTTFAQAMHRGVHSYYGLPIDVGTPGFRAGGALPVELSHFRPERDKATGAIVIAWSTESELNNAGFFIKRAQQRDGQFEVINLTMIPGAGTTSEKQFYTYTDTTAQPNVVYYYQIEDVSFDGNRRTLTRGIRLKGHIGAAGKADTTWADLKSSKLPSW